MRPLALAVAVLALPALAQSDPEPGLPAPPEAPAETAEVDSALVGAWQLDEVTEGGQLQEMGVEVEGMTCAFGAGGTARVEMEMVQDLDPLSHERTFEFETENGEILIEDDDPVRYRFLADGRLEMTTAGGLVVRLVRSRS